MVAYPVGADQSSLPLMGVSRLKLTPLTLTPLAFIYYQEISRTNCRSHFGHHQKPVCNKM